MRYATIADYRPTGDSSERDGRSIERGIIGPTFRDQLARARRGQGVFRANVLLRESACRVTRVDEPRHLKASHIKPWRDATDAERLDGSNGFLLSPHVDHLFDEGYITFSASQSLIIVPKSATDCSMLGVSTLTFAWASSLVSRTLTSTITAPMSSSMLS